MNDRDTIFHTRARLLRLDRPDGWRGGSVETVHGEDRRIWRKQHDEDTVLTVSYNPAGSTIHVTALETTRTGVPDRPTNVVEVETQRESDELIGQQAVTVMNQLTVHRNEERTVLSVR